MHRHTIQKIKECFHHHFVRKKEPKSIFLQPMSPFKLNWDIFMTVCLLYSCTTTPAQIALYEDGDLGLTWIIINWVVDALFFIDIVLIFNTAILNADYEVIEDRWEIAK